MSLVEALPRHALFNPDARQTRSEPLPEPDLPPGRGRARRAARRRWPPHTAALGAIILLARALRSSGQQGVATYQGLSQSLPFIERTQEAERRYAESSPPAGEACRCRRCETLAFEHVSYAYRADQPVLSDVSFEVTRGEVVGHHRSDRRGEVDADPDPAAVAERPGGQLSGERRARGAVRARRLAQAGRLRAPGTASAARHASPRTSASTARSTYDAVRAGRSAGPHPRRDHELARRAMTRSSALGPTRSRAASSSGSASPARWRRKPEVLVLDEPTSALDPSSEALIQESLADSSTS